jgi:hypothetical protein
VHAPAVLSVVYERAALAVNDWQRPVVLDLLLREKGRAAETFAWGLFSDSAERCSRLRNGQRRVTFFMKENCMLNGYSILDLLKDLRQQFKTFLREEIHLAKAELSEKVSRLGKDSVNIAIGGFVAYAGLIVFLGALGMLVAFALQQLGLDPFLSAFIGLGAIGFIIIAVGVIMLLTGLKAMKKESFTPKRTIETLQRVKGTERQMPKPTPPKPKKDERSSDEIQDAVVKSESRMAETLEELGDRLTMTHLRRQAKSEVQRHPYKWSLVAMGAGICGSYVMKRRLR